MELLFKRKQSAGIIGGATFKLWAKIELDEAEKAIARRYRFDLAVLIKRHQPGLVFRSIIMGIILGLVAWAVMRFSGIGHTLDVASRNIGIPSVFGYAVPLILMLFGGVLYHDYKRETLRVRDLLHGRNWACKSIVDLVKEEGYVADAVAVFRQVMESAKTWDDTEATEIEVLSKEDARRFIQMYV